MSATRISAFLRTPNWVWHLKGHDFSPEAMLEHTYVWLLIRALKSAAPSHPFRDKTCEMDGARCFYVGANQ